MTMENTHLTFTYSRKQGGGGGGWGGRVHDQIYILKWALLLLGEYRLWPGQVNVSVGKPGKGCHHNLGKVCLCLTLRGLLKSWRHALGFFSGGQVDRTWQWLAIGARKRGKKTKLPLKSLCRAIGWFFFRRDYSSLSYGSWDRKVL